VTAWVSTCPVENASATSALMLAAVPPNIFRYLATIWLFW
jgi:hypothetical protein